MQSKKISLTRLKELAKAQGLTLASFTGLAPLESSVKALNDWQRAGYAGEMAYMQRAPELLCTPQNLLPEARSMVSLAVLYEQQAVLERPHGSGRVARYAWGNDYHSVLKARLVNLVRTLEAQMGALITFKVFSDAVPLLERAVAERAGLGFIGKNSLLISPGTGSLFFLAEVLWDVEIEDSVLPVLAGTCGTCSRCIEACPTAAIVADKTIDARRCISYLTIEKRTEFKLWERRAIGEWVFGCDVCQEVCPFNHATLKRGAPQHLAEFDRSQGAGPFLELSEILAIRDDAAFRKRFEKSPLLRAKRRGLLRNAACVAANTLAEVCVPVLIDAASSDSEEMVRTHALWALSELGKAGSRVATQYLDKVQFHDDTEDA
ncbi:MAG: tRNA epoxyqueuosine(34) reductase QueG [Deltaproteobacteria bacterium]|nr:tRNA epoxyqueuosine(34) reductase QueG [Deltaproteobacteria bacterium]